LALAAASGERQSLYASFKRGCDDDICLSLCDGLLAKSKQQKSQSLFSL
jgi:hypothetical protein